MIFRASGYAILSASAPCHACGQWTHVVAIAVPGGHAVFAGDAWERAPLGARLFHVESLPATARRRMEELAPWYRPTPGFAGNGDNSGDPAGPCWRNHCEHCDAPIDDHELHGEPEGAFAPTDAGDGAEAHIFRWDVGETLEVVAGACAEDSAT